MKRLSRIGQRRWRLALLVGMCAAVAQAPTSAQPLPPPRPPEFGAATQQPTPAKPSPATPQSDIDFNHPVRRLGDAELRSQMLVCATRWAGMKRDGQTTGKLWSDFARDCLDSHPNGDK